MTIGKTATAHAQNDKSISVIYHETMVVHVDLRTNEITLNTGGWKTRTTMKRMNQASEHYLLGFKVFQKNYIWYVQHAGSTIEFDNQYITFLK